MQMKKRTENFSYICQINVKKGHKVMLKGGNRLSIQKLQPKNDSCRKQHKHRQTLISSSLFHTDFSNNMLNNLVIL